MRVHAVASTLAATWTCASTVAAITVRLRLRKPVGVKAGNSLYTHRDLLEDTDGGASSLSSLKPASDLLDAAALGPSAFC